MIIQPANRTLSVKEYYFSIKNKEMASLNVERKAQGLDPIINLGIGSPDGTPPAGKTIIHRKKGKSKVKERARLTNHVQCVT